MQDGCNDETVCVRTSIPAEPQLVTEVIPEAVLSTASIYSLGTDSRGNAFWVGNTSVFKRTSSGSFSEIGTLQAGRTPYPVMKDDSIYFYPDGNVDELVLVSDGSVTTKLAGAYDVHGLFQAEDGTILYLEEEVFSPNRVQFVPLNAQLERSEDADTYIAADEGELQPYDVYPLRSYGFVGRCRMADGSAVACASADGKTIASLGDANLQPTWFRFSFQPDSLWGIRDADESGDTKMISHWDGSEWHDETEIAARFPSMVAVVPLTPTGSELVAFRGDAAQQTSEALYFNGECWQPLHDFKYEDLDIGFSYSYSVNSLVQLDEAMAWLVRNGDGHDFHSFQLASFPNRK